MHEVNRAVRWKQQISQNCVFPLIYKGYDKAKCLLELKRAKIEIPTMYKMGYHNNNCIGCFKGGMGYWNKIRKDFPDVFNEVARLEHEFNATCLKKDGEKLFMSDLDESWGNHKDLEIPDCGLFCDIETEGLRDLTIEEAIKKLEV